MNYEPKTSATSDPVVERTEVLPISDFIVARQICFKGDHQLLVLMTNLLTNDNLIYDCSTQVESQVPDGVEVLQLSPSLNHETLYLTTATTVQQVDSLENANGYLELTTLTELSATATWTEVVHCGDETIAFSLTASGVLAANERQLVKNCTSCVATQSHLIFTTSNHFLKFVHILPSVTDLQVPPDQPEDEERCRSIERGAKLVTVMPSTYSLTLQMPRGNLETIYPRALVLASIRRNIETKKYRKAFLACRSQRVDMNILHDHAPTVFLENVGLFVDQVKRVDYIDLFLSQLRDEDVSQTMYKETIPRQPETTHALTKGVQKLALGDAILSPTASKVNRICDAFLTVLQDRYATNLQNVITAHVCKLPPDLEAGLGVVKDLRASQPDLADTAIEHICFLADVNRVYDAALGMYSLDLALLVAQQSQKDPREYLPYMQSLQELPELRRRFRLDDDLGRNRKALQHLYELKAIDEIQSYTQKHELYADALELYRYEPTTQALIVRLYADFLNSRNRYKDAAIAYTSLSDHASAHTCYLAATLWRECLTSALLIPLSPTALSDLALSLATSLTETNDHASAATIHLEHLSDLPSALRSHCLAHAFPDAQRLATLHRRPELIESIIDPALVDASATLTELLAECKAQLNAQVPRLRELRALKAADPLAFFEGAVKGAADIPDDVSIAPSSTSTTGGASLFTRYSGVGSQGTGGTTTTKQTSKNRRREERKRARGKRGSVYEEEYLVQSVGRLVERVNKVGAEVQATVEGCLGRGMRERARAVEAAMKEVVGMCEGCLEEVWEVGSGVPVASGLAGEAAVAPKGGEGVLWESLEQSWKKAGPPVVKKYEVSGLLG